MREAVMEAARMYAACHLSLYFSPKYLHHRIYLVHDDNKEKEFELEMTWVGDESNDLHVPVPADLLEEAKSKAKEALETFE